MTSAQPPSAPEPSHATPPRGIGDVIRQWWNGLPRVMQWLVGVPAIILIALLPVLNAFFDDILESRAVLISLM